jgi:hypothetical protein
VEDRATKRQASPKTTNIVDVKLTFVELHGGRLAARIKKTYRRLVTRSLKVSASVTEGKHVAILLDLLS